MVAEQQKHDGDDLPIDPLLGQPRMVDDPRITVAQAAAVLNKTPTQVRRYITMGRLPRHGPPNNFRPVLLSDVEALRDKGEPISLKVAARKLGRSIAATLELVADGELPLVPGTKTMVYPADIAAIRKTLTPRRIRQPQGPDGYIDTKHAAERLGLTGPYVTQLAAEEKIKAVFQDGQWWYDPGHIEMVRRARRARRERAIPRRPGRRHPTIYTTDINPASEGRSCANTYNRPD
ncbi:helix-turn-helix domain-containing protein [Kribbella sp. CA-245084]|uniref:helix-turn-helix domain-containing protein n=1 Tax=Kribbella sp. CA-245084 TaxID=3239940 RepID=UPI003D8A0E44